MSASVAPLRPEFEHTPIDASDIGAVERPLPFLDRLRGNTAIRRVCILVGLAVLWEVYARWLNNPLLFPTFSDSVAVLVHDLIAGELLNRVATSLQVLALGYAAGVAVAAVLTTLAVSTRLGSDLLATLTAMFNPLPAIALLPLALIWFGLGVPSLVFVLVHGTLWAIALNTNTGFRSVPDVLRMTGRNYGLHGVRYVVHILIPAAFPSILAGLKIGWAFAWRTLIAAELVFGVSARSGGLGWYIFEAREELQTDKMFAGLLTVILIGLFIESVVFRAIEVRTVQKWGMER